MWWPKLQNLPLHRQEFTVLSTKAAINCYLYYQLIPPKPTVSSSNCLFCLIRQTVKVPNIFDLRSRHINKSSKSFQMEEPGPGGDVYMLELYRLYITSACHSIRHYKVNFRSGPGVILRPEPSLEVNTREINVLSTCTHSDRWWSRPNQLTAQTLKQALSIWKYTVTQRLACQIILLILCQDSLYTCSQFLEPAPLRKTAK